MAAYSTYLANAMLAHVTGKTAFGLPVAYVGLIRATAGQSPRSTAVTVGQTTIPAALNGHMYRCTTAGTTGAGEPTWPVTSAGTVTDGTAVWTEMTPDFQANNTNITGNEANYTGYARVQVPGASWNTPAAGSTSNSAAIGFGQCTAGVNPIGTFYAYDALTGGNPLFWGTCNVAVSVNITPSFAAGALQLIET
jgi:hypothetical protein